MKYNNVLIVSHKFLTQPDDELVFYLNKLKTKKILHIMHSFSDAPDRKSYYRLYKNGKLEIEYQTKDYKDIPEILIYFKELFFTLKWLISLGKNWDLYVGMDGMCVLFGNIGKYLGKIKKTIFWAIDFVPENRFSNSLKNKIYHTLNINGYSNSDEMWDLSPRMAEAREKFLGINKSSYKKHRIVPYGVWWNNIKRYTYEQCEKNTLVFMGHLLEKQGVQYVIRSIKKIRIKIPNIYFKIIGTGSYENRLREIVKEENLSHICEFKGKIEDFKKLQEEIARSCVAIAPYDKKLDTWTYYADPGKVKEYLACGIPVILTDVPWNAKSIEENKCGQIIDLNTDDITTSVVKLMDPVINKEYRKNSITYSKSYDYEKIFNEIFI